MALPTLTSEDRKAALHKAGENRKERAELLAALKTGELDLAAFLARDDAVVAKTPVRRVVESMPGIGQTKAAKLMADIGIADNRRVRGLGGRQRAALLAAFVPQTSPR